MKYLVTATYKDHTRTYECDSITTFDTHALLYRENKVIHLISYGNKNFLGLDIEQEGLI